MARAGVSSLGRPSRGAPPIDQDRARVPDEVRRSRYHTALPYAGGLAAGLVAGLFGVGGGVLLVPLLVLVLRQPQHVAHATSLVGVTLAALASVVRFGVGDSVALWGALALAVGAVAGARAGAVLMPKVSARGLRRIFALVMVAIAIRFLVAGSGGGDTGGAIPDLDVLTFTLHALGGFGAGVASSLLGVGGGVIFVPLLVVGFGYGQHAAEGTSLAVIVPTALTGAVSHAQSGYTDWRLGAQLGVAAVVGGVIGASAALALSADVLARLFGALLLVVGALMFRNEIRDA